MNVRGTVVLAAVALISLGGCIFPKSAPPPSALSADQLEAARSRWPDATAEALEEGRQLFLASCDGCHDYPDLAHYSEQDWPEIMQRMGDKSDLSADQTAQVLQFVLVSRQSLTQP